MYIPLRAIHTSRIYRRVSSAFHLVFSASCRSELVSLLIAVESTCEARVWEVEADGAPSPWRKRNTNPVNILILSSLGNEMCGTLGQELSPAGFLVLVLESDQASRLRWKQCFSIISSQSPLHFCRTGFCHSRRPESSAQSWEQRLFFFWQVHAVPCCGCQWYSFDPI